MANDCTFGLGYLPVIWSLFTIFSFTITYTVAVISGHVYPILPSISDTGTQLPESNIFSLLMNISIIFALANFIVRYFQFQHQARHCEDSKGSLHKHNTIALVCALIAVVSALFVANIPSRKEYCFQQIHDSAAAVMFIFANLYFWLQSRISYKVYLYGVNSLCLCVIRFFLCALMTGSALLYFVTSMVCYELYDNGYNDKSGALWKPDENGYILHIVSSASEWFSFLVIIIYGFTFFDEFQQVIVIVDCQERLPTIISYDGIGDYTTLKMSSMDSLMDDANN